MAKRRHVRESDRLDDEDIVVVRGGTLGPATLRFDAERYHGVYGDFGLSVFAARGVAVDELAQSSPLVRFEVLTLVRVGALRSAGFRTEATGKNPRHFTVVFDDLDAGIESLGRCEHRS